MLPTNNRGESAIGKILGVPPETGTNPAFFCQVPYGREGLQMRARTESVFATQSGGGKRRGTNISHLFNEVIWSGLAQGVKIVHHMHLVMITEEMRDLEPGAAGSSELRVQSGLKTSHTREGFWCGTDTAMKFSFELTQAHHLLSGETGDAESAPCLKDLRGGRRHSAVPAYAK
jgi:hypothetical protein